MKAEHRKELQTNALADRMGRMIQRMKTRPKRGTVVTWLLIALLVGAVVLFFWSRRNRSTENAQKWILLEAADLRTLANELGDEPSTPQGKAARFQIAWRSLWNEGVRAVGVAPGFAMERVTVAQRLYRALAEETKDDPVLGPEALYGVAVAEEALAVEAKDTDDQIHKAEKRYKDVVDKFPTSARGKAAKKRYDELKDNDKRIEIVRFYNRMERVTRDKREQYLFEKQIEEMRKKKQ
jgi:hypothetical protein